METRDTDYYDRNLQGKAMSYRACLYCMIGMAAILMLLFLTSCRTVRSEESTVDRRFMTELDAKMDSLISRTSTWQETFLTRQTSIIDSFRRSEVRDTSHTVFLGAKGDTVKETIIIRQFVEKEHSSDTKETEQLVERFRRTDSLLQVSLARQEKTDSLLHEYQKTTVVERQLTLWERLKAGIGGYAIMIVLVILTVVCFRIVRWLRRKRPLAGT